MTNTFTTFTYNLSYSLNILSKGGNTSQNKTKNQNKSNTLSLHDALPICWEDLLEKGMATHSSNLACRIPWTEEPDGLQSMGSQRVGDDRVTFTATQL